MSETKEGRTDEELSQSRAEELVGAAAEVCSNGENCGKTRMRVDDTMDDTRKLLTEALSIRCEMAAKLAEESGRGQIVRDEYDRRKIKFGANIAKIHTAFRPTIRDRLGRWLWDLRS